MKCAFERNREFDAVPKMVRSENEDLRGNCSIKFDFSKTLCKMVSAHPLMIYLLKVIGSVHVNGSQKISVYK